MAAKAVAPLDRKHMLGEDVLLGQGPIGRDVRWVDVLVGIEAFRYAAPFCHLVEGVHLPAVARKVICLPRMMEVELIDQSDLTQRDGAVLVDTAGRVGCNFAGRGAVGAR